MSNCTFGFRVILDGYINDEDLERIQIALESIKNVIEVLPISFENDGRDEYYVAKSKIKNKIMELLENK